MGFFSGWFVSYQVATRCPKGGHKEQGTGRCREERAREKHSASKSEQEVPHCVCSALRVLGEVQRGEVNIVRRGGASLGGQPLHASHRQGPSQLSPSRMLGPCRHLEKPRSRACPSSPQHRHPLRGLNQAVLTLKSWGSHLGRHNSTSHSIWAC